MLKSNGLFKMFKGKTVGTVGMTFLTGKSGTTSRTKQYCTTSAERMHLHTEYNGMGIHMTENRLKKQHNTEQFKMNNLPMAVQKEPIPQRKVQVSPALTITL